MSLATVRADLARRAPEVRVQEGAASTATVALAAQALGIPPERVAKTLAVQLAEPVLIVTRGDARLDNAKFKAAFGTKPRLLDGEAAIALTGHEIGGVCPFGLPSQVQVFCDISLQSFETVFPAAGSANSWLEIGPERLAGLTDATWIDVSRY
jgi:prolyl-tRNA editing enzyme YbaK/EbsC (Cys-tRNA(Pro) deacylase)